ncbi:DUF5700 domain-containing putative Zn-dependent protease [Allosphingosinicella vermicomposti]|uniref:DUF5700 domain-containing putative Zn-dependent protease n=1 Tax=Allosphingosinicella vermicomposti TaxID=614671 RepID=UPI000D0F4020|nr:DUF5700 domain-containing putative Zn-dependent protease [Allosphingosinicella vermicomposti]
MRSIMSLMGLLLGLTLTGRTDAAEITIDVDTALANRLLTLSCSGQPVDEAEFAASSLLKAQLAHHARFGEKYSLENYVAGVRSIAACKAPDPDPFRFTALVTQRGQMAKAIATLSARKAELGDGAAALTTPYVPAGTRFAGSVVLAPATLSCGGFARGGHFFIDLPCIAEQVEGEFDAVRRLVAHETYHAVQGEFMPDPKASLSTVATPAEAHEYLFHRLAAEGSATYVARMAEVAGDGRYATRSREDARRNRSRLTYNFRLFNLVVEALAEPRQDYGAHFKELYGLAFDGAFGELSYFVGEQMAAEIDRDFGPQALVCVLSLPPEHFILAYDQALRTSERLEKSYPLTQATLAAAQGLSRTRENGPSLGRCLPGAPG